MLQDSLKKTASIEKLQLAVLRNYGWTTLQFEHYHGWMLTDIFLKDFDIGFALIFRKGVKKICMKIHRNLQQ